MGLDPKAVGMLLLEAFADMTFVHGHVHGDPHPGPPPRSQGPGDYDLWWEVWQWFDATDAVQGYALSSQSSLVMCLGSNLSQP